MSVMTPADPSAIGPIHTATLALEARLKLIFPTTRFQHEVLPAPLSLRAFGQLSSTRTPLVALHFVGLRPDGGNARTYAAQLRFNLGLVISNQRARPRLLGDNQAPGMAQMLHAAIVGLQGFAIGGDGAAGAGPIELGEANALDGSEWAGNNLVAVGLGITARASFQALNPDEFLRFGATWSFDPAPDDGPAAASDEINVRES